MQHLLLGTATFVLMFLLSFRLCGWFYATDRGSNPWFQELLSRILFYPGLIGLAFWFSFCASRLDMPRIPDPNASYMLGFAVFAILGLVIGCILVQGYSGRPPGGR